MADSYYQTRYSYDKNRTIVWKEIVRFLRPYIKKSESVLDVAAGYCDFINNVEAKKRVALDISDESSKYADQGVSHIRSSITDMKVLADNSFDVVFASNILEHLDDNELTLAIREIKRVLRVGGVFIAMQPNFRLNQKHYFDDPTHKKIFTDASLQAFLESNSFKIEKMYPRFLPFSLKSRPSIIPISSLVVRTYLYSPIKPFAGQMLAIARLNDK